jgi:archaetidylinositol phosphate synthase
MDLFATTITTPEKPFTPARRLNHSLTASLEKRLLEYLAHHAPRGLTSDQLTLLGLASQISAGVFYALSHWNKFFLLAVILCLILNWLGDSLDGTLARVRHQQRPRFGFYVDHIVDCFGVIALMSGLAFSGFLHWPVAIAMLVAFLLLSAESYLATYTLSCFQLSTGIFGPTEIRLLLIAGNLALLRSPYSNLFGHRFLLFDLGGIIASICMLATVIALTLRHTAQLYREEPLP